MKRLLFLLLLLPLLTACPPDKDTSKETLKKFRKDGYNMTSLKTHVYGTIRFRLPATMQHDYSTHYAYKSTAFRRREQNLGILFTAERFQEADRYSELMEEYVYADNDLLNSFHDAYVNRRMHSLDQGGASFKKEVRSNVKFPGAIQVVSGESTYDDALLYYATATLKVDEDYYIFQFICDKPMMDYVYDDFERILASVRKK